MPYTGEIRMFAGSFAPQGWLQCDGSTVSNSSYPDLAPLLSPVFGGNATTFKLPDLRGRLPIHNKPGYALGAAGGVESVVLTANQIAAHTHPLLGTDGSATARSGTSSSLLAESQGRIYGSPPAIPMSPSSLSSAGTSQPHDNMMPSVPLMFIICTSGTSPSQTDQEFQDDVMYAEIKMFAGNRTWKNFANCEGQLLSISQNSALFSLLGTYYGGDGRVTFALPDLRGAAPIGAGSGPGLTPRLLGLDVGSSAVTLNATQLPSHTHSLLAASVGATNDPGGNALAVPFGGANLYTTGAGTPIAMAPTGIGGGGQPHNNMQPYVAVTYMIATQGIFPSRPF